MTSTKKHLAISTLVVLLTGCGIGGMAGPFPGGYEVVDTSTSSKPKVKPAAPQVVYRIDENRFFEVVPIDDSPCWGTLYYTDKTQAIHKGVARFGDLSARGPFIIDAANTDYLVGPIIAPNGNCAADTAGRPSCSSRLPYSTDGGRTWKYTTAFGGSSIALIGSMVYGYSYSTYYKSYSGDSFDLKKLINEKDIFSSSRWTEFYTKETIFPALKKMPIDTQFQCNRNAEN